jgi:glutathione S-transferase
MGSLRLLVPVKTCGKMASIVLYYSPGACSLASHVLLKEIGVKFDAVKVDVKAGCPESFRKVNPKMRVPVLSIDKNIITETTAIFTAISQLAPERHFLGSSNLEVVRSYEWLNWLSGTLHGQAFGGLFRPHRYADDPALYDAIKAKGWKNVEDCFEKIESQLSGLHAVGDDFTAVDVFLYVFYRWANSGRAEMANRYPKYTKLVVELAKRPSVQETLEAEGVPSFLPKL